MKNNKLEGIKGYLSFYVGIYIIFILYFIFAILKNVSLRYIARTSDKIYFGLSDFGRILLISLFMFSIIYVLYLTFSKKKKAILFNIIYLWIFAFLFIVGSWTFVGIYMFTVYPILIVWTLIWTVYFKKSERVKNTFIK